MNDMSHTPTHGHHMQLHRERLEQKTSSQLPVTNGNEFQYRQRHIVNFNQPNNYRTGDNKTKTSSVLRGTIGPTSLD